MKYISIIAISLSASLADDQALKGALDKFTGSWTCEVSATDPKGETSNFQHVNTFSWIMGGKFLQDNGIGADGGNDFIGYWFIDPATKQIHSNYFLPMQGNALVQKHEWDADKKTISAVTDLGAGMRMATRDVFHGKDRYTWKVTVSDPEGGIVQDMQGDCTRKQ